MKLISYAHTLYDVRVVLAAGEQLEAIPDAPALAYPENVTVRNMCYFLAAPTLCYQLGYPRTSRIRWVSAPSLTSCSLHHDLRNGKIWGCMWGSRSV